MAGKQRLAPGGRDRHREGTPATSLRLTHPATSTWRTSVFPNHNPLLPTHHCDTTSSYWENHASAFNLKLLIGCRLRHFMDCMSMFAPLYAVQPQTFPIELATWKLSGHQWNHQPHNSLRQPLEQEVLLPDINQTFRSTVY